MKRIIKIVAIGIVAITYGKGASDLQGLRVKEMGRQDQRVVETQVPAPQVAVVIPPRATPRTSGAIIAPPPTTQKLPVGKVIALDMVGTLWQT
ncbi:MAG: hypothetical protein LBJ92_03535 [Holosporales bacterium]|nr:hypothetical protein [Holosporales bacterium]